LLQGGHCFLAEQQPFVLPQQLQFLIQSNWCDFLVNVTSAGQEYLVCVPERALHMLGRIYLPEEQMFSLVPYLRWKELGGQLC